MGAKRILITGCSSGIGAATVRALAAAGHDVIATAPSDALLLDIPDVARSKLVLDVTDQQTIDAVYQQLSLEQGGLDVLINNAGYCQAGPLELLSQAQVERQFAVNVYGPLAMIRTFAPMLRKSNEARIINLSSMLGLMSMPVIGIYSASKYAVEGFSDALRMEMADQGVAVILIEPGWINSNLALVAEQQANYSWRDRENCPYRARMQRNSEQKKDPSAVEGQVGDVAKVILKAVSSKNPRARYKVTLLAYVLPLIKRLLPTRCFDALISKMAW